MQLFIKWLSPKYFESFSKQCLPWLWFLFFICLGYGLLGGLYLSPPDYQQGDAFRIIYVHVPSAAMSLSVYVAMTFFSLLYLVFRIRLADILAKMSAPLGAVFTALALATGMIWGKPMWGTAWIWDARLTSELILLFLYAGIIALRLAIPLSKRASSACAILALVGLVNIPIIHYSVYWWNTLHQKSTLLKLSKPDMAPAMLYPLIAMLLAFALYYVALLLMKTRLEIRKSQ